MRTSFFLLYAFLLSLSLSTTTLKAQHLELLNADEFEVKMQSLEGCQLVDIRTPEDYKEGHLKNALNLNFKESSFVELLGTLDKEKPVAVYGKTGKLSPEAALKIMDLGFKNVYHLQGGMIAWTKANKPVVSEKSKSSDEKFTSGDLKKIVTSTDVVLVDFYATWCIPCMKMEPAMDTLSKEFAGKIEIVRVNVEHSKALAEELRVKGNPGGEGLQIRRAC